MSATQTIGAAAGRHDDNALDWIFLAEKAGSVNEVDLPGRDWVSLDRRLTSAFTKIAHGELGRQITLMNSIAVNAGRTARGRSLLRLVFQHYASGSSAEFMCDTNHCQGITLKGDQIEAFQNNWKTVLSELKKHQIPK